MAFVNPLRKLSFETKGWITLFSGFTLHFVLGTFYLWGSISTYTTSYLVQDGQNYTKEDVGAVFPFTFLAINIGTPFGVHLAKKIGWNFQIFIGSILIGISTIISSYVINIFPLFVLFYGVIFGILNGLLYMVPFNTCYLYLPHRKGLVSGTIVGGFGFGSAAFIWLIYSIVNPNNQSATDVIHGVKYFSKDICDKFPQSLRVLGIVQIAIGIFSSLIHIRPTPEEVQEHEEKMKSKNSNQGLQMGMMALQQTQGVSKQQSSLVRVDSQNEEKPLQTDIERGTSTESDMNKGEKSPTNKNIRPQFEQQQAATQSIPLGENLALAVGTSANCNQVLHTQDGNQKKQQEVYYEFQSFKDGMKTKFIYYSIALGLMFTVYGQMIVSNYKLYGENFSYTDNFLSTVGTVGSVMNGVTRVFWGSLMEKFSILQLIWANVIIQIIISFTFRWVAQFAALFFLNIVLGYFVYGGWLSILPTLIARIYGKKIGTSIYGVTFFGFSCASFIQFFLVKEVQAAIDWGNTFWVFTAIQILALIVSNIMRFNAEPPTASQETVKPIKIEEEQINSLPQQA